MNRVFVYTGLVIAFVIAGSIGALVLLAPAPNKVGPTRPIETAKQEDTSVDALRDLIRKGAEVESARGVLGQLNNHLAELESRPKPLPEDQLKQVTERYNLDAGEVAEITNGNYTLLDAYHVEACSLLSDVARTLRLEELKTEEQAAAAFAWVVRNVRLREGEVIAVPTAYILRRGWGSSLERALVFVALLDQMGIDSCMITAPMDYQGEKRPRYWLPGALIGKSVYLFDTRMGIPLPGPQNKGIATLQQARNQPESISMLKPSKDVYYDVSPAQTKEVEVLTACQLSAMAPRMQYLQERLEGAERITFHTDPLARLKRFETALASEPGLVVKPWSQPLEINAPTRVLRYFLPVEEGGIDKSNRRELAKRALIPTKFLPPRIATLPGDLGQRVIGLFSNPFIYFNSEPRMPTDYMKFWLPGLLETTRDKNEPPKVPDFMLRGSLPRDLTIRGRFDEATNMLVSIRDELRRQRSRRAAPGLDKEVEAWCDRAVATTAEAIRAQQQGINMEQKLEQLWAGSRSVQVAVLGSAAEPMLADVLYLLALTKHEQAVRMQARADLAKQKNKPRSESDQKLLADAWKTANNWWTTYLNGESITPDAAAAQINHATALQALGDKEKAIQVYENVSALPPQSLERTARQHLVQQLRAK